MGKSKLLGLAVLGLIAGTPISSASAAGPKGLPTAAAAPAQAENVVHGTSSGVHSTSSAAPVVSTSTESNSSASALPQSITSSTNTKFPSPPSGSQKKTLVQTNNISASSLSSSHDAIIRSMILSLEKTIELLMAEMSVTANNSSSGHVHQFRPRLDPKGNVLHGTRNEVESSNWSGYVVSRYMTAREYTAASGTWTVPAVDAASAGYSSSWVGIGGFCINQNCTQIDHTLIQLGTEQEADGFGNTNYYAWYETLPDPEIKIESFPVNPGDTITASLKEVSGHGRRGTWLLSLDDKTTGSVWSRTVSYNSSLDSAEWIEEAPYSGIILPLADYSMANFDFGTVNGAENPALAAPESVIMYNPNGQTSNPSAPDSDTDCFNACWGNYNMLASCSPSNS